MRRPDWKLGDWQDWIDYANHLEGKIDGPSGLREQLVAARTGEQIEHRMRTKAEARLDEALRRVEELEAARDAWRERALAAEKGERVAALDEGGGE